MDVLIAPYCDDETYLPRLWALEEVSTALVEKGYNVLSPVVYFHSLFPFYEQEALDRFTFSALDAADKLIILRLKGWRDCEYVNRIRARAIELHKKVELLNYGASPTL